MPLFLDAVLLSVMVGDLALLNSVGMPTLKLSEECQPRME